MHQQKVKKLQELLRRNENICSLKKSAPSNTLRNGEYKKESARLDLSSFTEILEWNVEEKWIVVEPKITFKKLCHFTLKQGLIPPVVPEFSSITVGGAIMGAALESSSHRNGQVNDACLEYECLLGNGERITLSPTENSELFYGCTGSYGTLAILTAIKMRLVLSKKWVKLQFHCFSDLKHATDMLTTPRTDDFIEGIVFSPAHARVITANMTDSPEESKVFRHNRYWSPWYAQHVLKTQRPEEYMTLEEYLFRFDRGCFWIGRCVHSWRVMTRLLFHLGIPKIKNHSFDPSVWFRLMFGWAFSSSGLYRLWHRVPNQISENLFFIHDFYAPFPQAYEVLRSFMEQTEIFPIWLCPIKGTSTPQFLSPHYGGCDFLNIGLYGIPSRSCSVPELSQRLEKEIVAFGGRKMLYSFTYYDRDTFSKIYSKVHYDYLRQKYSAEGAFPPLYDKIVTSE